MKVFTVFEPGAAGRLRVWARSWEARGWETQVLTARKLAGEEPQHFVNRQKGSPLLASLNHINFGWPAKEANLGPRVQFFGNAFWREAPVVCFPPGTTEEDVLGCGRPL